MKKIREKIAKEPDPGLPWMSRERFLRHCQNKPNALHPLLRLFLLSDGTVVHFLQALFVGAVSFELVEQSEIVIAGDDAERLPDAKGEKGIQRTGWLQVKAIGEGASGKRLKRAVYTTSLFSIADLPPDVYQALQMREKPLGKILYDYKLTFRRDHVEMGQCVLPDVACGFGVAPGMPLWARRCHFILSGARETSGLLFEVPSPDMPSWTDWGVPEAL